VSATAKAAADVDPEYDLKLLYRPEEPVFFPRAGERDGLFLFGAGKVIVNLSSRLQIICRYTEVSRSIWNYTWDGHNWVTI
jgi:hypothetical protein